ncbi:hypothetical protein BO83DRAFT_219722 [Aspergillus eucalypticola CBS 122712]|uniref:Uncharacterized protein n=1 Tax=Aspergillus eucalypticola (strain CBS 122712 / IBT 29274) TaxID=1448314 RepID=A0A317VZL0_ASPEC|nr:uncharacterized protein BO83DRAFT_219722 [Aspergillus eucalypticola CBS 122712]PWY79089.1 hypothetical protein BO83DRAFT_219722 [Aspergillus eucalypticola CBS 122712]
MKHMQIKHFSIPTTPRVTLNTPPTRSLIVSIQTTVISLCIRHSAFISYSVTFITHSLFSAWIPHIFFTLRLSFSSVLALTLLYPSLSHSLFLSIPRQRNY